MTFKSLDDKELAAKYREARVIGLGYFDELVRRGYVVAVHTGQQMFNAYGPEVIIYNHVDEPVTTMKRVRRDI